MSPRERFSVSVEVFFLGLTFQRHGSERQQIRPSVVGVPPRSLVAVIQKRQRQYSCTIFEMKIVSNKV